MCFCVANGTESEPDGAWIHRHHLQADGQTPSIGTLDESSHAGGPDSAALVVGVDESGWSQGGVCSVIHRRRGFRRLATESQATMIRLSDRSRRGEQKFFLFFNPFPQADGGEDRQPQLEGPAVESGPRGRCSYVS